MFVIPFHSGKILHPKIVKRLLALVQQQLQRDFYRERGGGGQSRRLEQGMGLDDHLNELLERYREAAIKHGQGTPAGDPKLTNRSHDIIVSTFKEIKREEYGLERLAKFLEDEDTSVRSWAACNLLHIENTDATILLGFNAKMTLKEWDTGKLIFWRDMQRLGGLDE